MVLTELEKGMLDIIISESRSEGPFTGMILNNVVLKSDTFDNVTDEKIESAIKLALRIKQVAKNLVNK